MSDYQRFCQDIIDIYRNISNIIDILWNISDINNDRIILLKLSLYFLGGNLYITTERMKLKDESWYIYWWCGEYDGLIFNMKTSASHYYMFNRKYEGHKDDDNGTKLDINMM